MGDAWAPTCGQGTSTMHAEPGWKKTAALCLLPASPAAWSRSCRPRRRTRPSWRRWCRASRSCSPCEGKAGGCEKGDREWRRCQAASTAQEKQALGNLKGLSSCRRGWQRQRGGLPPPQGHPPTQFSPGADTAGVAVHRLAGGDRGDHHVPGARVAAALVGVLSEDAGV